MKKFLSLVLALVMTMSLVTISAGAKDFTDADKVNYDEAIAVLSAVKVIDGYTDGSFKPQTPLNRGQAAKIICNLVLGPTTAAELSATVAPFSDVPANNIFAGYITYCANEGIICGYGDGTFRPTGSLTGYAFLKMLLGALGYDAEIEGYNNPGSFGIQVAKQAIGIGLNKGLKDTFDGNKTVTREEACLYALNTLKATMVEYDSKIIANVNGAQITVGTSLANEVKWNIAASTDGNIKDDGYVQFAEKYFPKLELEIGNGIYGRPANTWKLKKSEIGTYTSIDPTYVYTEATEEKDVYKDLGKAVCDTSKDGYDWTAFINGVEEEPEDLKVPASKSDDDYKYTGDGAVTEIYVDVDRETVTVCEINYYIGQVTKVKDDTITVKALSNEAKILDVNTFETEGFDEDDYVVFTVDFDEDEDDYIIGEVLEPKTVTGEVKRVEKDITEDNKKSYRAYLKLEDGEKYPYSEDMSANDSGTFTHIVYDLDELLKREHPELNKEYILYMDPNGFVLGFELAEDEVNQYLYVQDSDEEMKDWVAKVVLTDATNPKVDLKEKLKDYEGQIVKYVDEELGAEAEAKDKENKKIALAEKIQWIENQEGDKDGYSKDGRTSIDNRVWKYSVSDKGVYTLTYVDNVVLGAKKDGKGDFTAEINNGKAYITEGGDHLIVDMKTVFVDVDGEKSYVGYKEVPNVENALLVCVVNDDLIAEVVFILDGDIYDENGTYFVLAKDKRESGKDGDEKFWEYFNAYVNGEKSKGLFVTYDAVKELTGAYDKQLKCGVLYKATKTIKDGQYIDEIEEICDGNVCTSPDDVRCGVVTSKTNAKREVIGEAVGDNAFWLTNADKKEIKFDTDSETVYVTVREVKTLKSDGSYKTEYQVTDGSIKDLKKIDADGKYTYSQKVVHVAKKTNDETARLVYIFWTETEIGETKTLTFTVDTDANVASITVNGVAVDSKGQVETAKGQDAEITITPKAGFAVSKVSVDGKEIEANKDGTYTIPEVTKNTKVKVETRKDESGVVTVKDESRIAIVTVNGKRINGTSEKIEGEVTIKVQQKADAAKIGSIVIEGVEVAVGETYTTTMTEGGITVTVNKAEEVKDAVVNVEATNAYVTYANTGYADGAKIAGLEKGNVIRFKVAALDATGDDKTTVEFNGDELTANASGEYVAIVAEGENTLKVEVAPKTYTVKIAKDAATGYTNEAVEKTAVRGDKVTVKLTATTNATVAADSLAATITGVTTSTKNTAGVADVPAAYVKDANINSEAAFAAAQANGKVYLDDQGKNEATAYVNGMTYYVLKADTGTTGKPVVVTVEITVGTANIDATTITIA